MDPSGYIVLFDGECNLCAKSVQFIIRHDKHQVFKFASIQSSAGRQLLLRSNLDPDNLDSFVLITPTGALTKSSAAIEIALLFGGCWRVFAIFKFLPMTFRDSVYLFIASRRYAWFGRRESCFVPSRDLAKRFLDSNDLEEKK